MSSEKLTGPSRVLLIETRHIALLVFALLGAASAPASRAADAASDDAAAAKPSAENPNSAAGPTQLAEITVTATRREESLSKVPISVSAFSQETMDQRGVKDITDLVRYTPGVSIDQTGTNAISIRGISSSGGAGTTGIYIDDTPIQMRSLGFNPDDTLPKTFDLDRVEVLRGPQGTLFGAGSEGGTVRYILAQPSLTTATSYVKSEVSDTEYGEPSYEAGVAHGGPIIDGVLGYRASIWYRKDGGWIDRVDPTTGAVVDHDANTDESFVVRLASIWRPIGALTVTPSIFYQNKQEHDVSTYWPAYSDPSAGRFDNANPDRLPVPDKFYLPALKIEADLGKVRLVSNTSYYHRDETTGYEGTVYNLSYYQTLGWPAAASSLFEGVSFLNPADYPLIDTSGIHLPPGLQNYRSPATVENQQRSETEEIRLESNDPTSRHTWTVGAFWQLSREYSLEEIHDPMLNDLLETLYGQNALQIFGEALLPNGDSYYNPNTAHDRQIAGFGEATYSLTDRLKLTLGGRVAKTSFDITHFTDGPQNEGPNGPVSASQKETPFTPKAGLSFQMDPNNLFYFTYAKGFRVGGANAPLPSYCMEGLIQEGYASGQAPETYKSDSTQSYEIGSKNNFDNILKIASSVYYIKWNDIQQNVYVNNNCGLQFTDNLGTAVAKGFDLQADAALGAISLEAAIGYTSARYVRTSKNDLAIDGDAISGQAAINGSPGTNPPWNVTLGAQYDFALFAHKSFARLDYEFDSRNPWLAAIQDPRSSQYATTENGSVYPTQISPTLPSTTFVQFRTGMEFNSGWQVSFFIDNLLNTHVTTNYERTFIDGNNPHFPPPGPQYNYYTFRPRTFGITGTLHM
jgi:iron complex outermembrane receptor protein